VTRSPHCILSHILRACPDGLVLIAVYGSAAELQDLFPRYVVRCRRAGKREVDAIGNHTWALPPCWSYNDAIACYSDCICCLLFSYWLASPTYMRIFLGTCRGLKTCSCVYQISKSHQRHSAESGYNIHGACVYFL